MRLYAVRKANKIIAEINQGGALVESNPRARQGGQNLPYKGISVKKGKLIRAEPAATPSEQGMIHFVGSFPKLETELTTWDPQDSSANSPNRLDAMVFPATELMIEGGLASFAGIPQITSSFRRDRRGSRPRRRLMTSDGCVDPHLPESSPRCRNQSRAAGPSRRSAKACCEKP